MSSIKTIGLTGGIGSGKSTVARVFEVTGIPVYSSDDRAKAMYFEPDVRAKVLALLGPEAYLSEREINKAYIASRIFSDKNILDGINGIIHPAVGRDFEKWYAIQKNVPFVLKESALLFETGIYKNMDANILVVSPEHLRARRIALRDKLSEEEVLKRFKNQLNDDQKIPYADYIITNDEEQSLIEQVLDVKKKIAE
ncbi:MAG: putative dephospho-CoA kinase [Bacteroidetes bacterium]|jgi:dephospho-CoA kinase|nr:putative dephospho-CoA kinase [Bacteroidota bacterium]